MTTLLKVDHYSHTIITFYCWFKTPLTIIFSLSSQFFSLRLWLLTLNKSPPNKAIGITEMVTREGFLSVSLRAPTPFGGTAGSVRTFPLPGFELNQAYTESSMTWERMCDRPNFNRRPQGWVTQDTVESADLWGWMLCCAQWLTDTDCTWPAEFRRGLQHKMQHGSRFKAST